MITIASHLLFFHFSYTHYSYLIFFISLFFKRQFTCKKFILLNGYEKNILNSVLSVLYSSFFSTSLNIIKWTIIATKILLRVQKKTWMKTSKILNENFFLRSRRFFLGLSLSEIRLDDTQETHSHRLLKKH